MKKNLKHSLIAVLITLSLIVTVGIAVVAASTETDVASFEKADGSVVYFDSLEEAVTAAKSEAKKGERHLHGNSS